MSGLVILHGCRTVQLTKGMNTLVDEDDWAKVGSLRWNPNWNRHTHYARRSRNVADPSRPKGRRWIPIFLHRVLMDAPDGFQVDHRNGDGLDNRKSNLRIVTRSQNGANRRKAGGRSRFKGVFFGKPSWQAYIRVNGRLKCLGSYPTEEDAARAYDTAAREFFGEFACTNADIHGDY